MRGARAHGGQGPGGGAEESARLRAATERAILQLSGERGYRNVTVAALIERSGSNRSRFYATFGSKDGCFAAAYSGAIEGLAARLLRACDDGDRWVEGMRNALVELESFVGEDRDLAAGVLVGVYAAGEDAAAKRLEVWERLAEAIDRGRAMGSKERRPPPRSTGMFVLQAIETAVVRNLSEERPLALEVPGLLYLAIVPYVGPEAAWSEVGGLG
jgi:AcrR family transcriptional regulator